MSPRLLTIAIVATLTSSAGGALAQEAPAPEPAPALAPAPAAEAPSSPQADPQAPLPPPPSSPPATTFQSPPEGAAAEARQPEARPERRPRFVVGASFGVGTASFGTGLGLRLGYLARSGVYIGGLFQYHFGESAESGSPGFVTTTGVTYFIHQFELGYAAKAGPVEIRPYFALGPGFGFTSREGYQAFPTFGSRSNTHGTAVITPGGLSITVDLGKTAYVGIDGRPMFFVQTVIPQAAVGLVTGARF